MSNIEKLELKDPEGIYKNITDLLDELRNKNIKAVSLVYERKDGSTRTFWSGWNRIHLIGILEQLKFDLICFASENAEATKFE